MARSLDFIVGGNSFACELNTVDRSKLYGSVSTETLDQEGRRCELATLALDGKTLIPYGGTASGYVNGDGDWISRSDLVAVDANGEKLDEVESSFDNPIDLDRIVPIEEFLNHSIRLLYALDHGDDLPEEFVASMSSGAIYRFEFSYRGGVDTDPAFILMDKENSLWMLVAEDTDIQFVGLEQAAVCANVATTDVDEAEDDQALDFSML